MSRGREWRRMAFAIGFAIYAAAVGFLSDLGDRDGGFRLFDVALLGLALLIGYWLWAWIEAAAAPGSPLRPTAPRLVGAVLGGVLVALAAALLLSLAGGDVNLASTLVRSFQIGAPVSYLAWPLIARGGARPRGL